MYLVFNWKLYPYWLAFVMLGDALYTVGGEN